jgi:hypothetical protein
MAALFFIAPTPQLLWAGLIIFSIGGFIQEIAFINYYAMLKQVSKTSNIGKVSGFAWGFGYVGGIVLLLISLLLAALLFRANVAWEPFARRNAWATTASISHESSMRVDIFPAVRTVSPWFPGTATTRRLSTSSLSRVTMWCTSRR